MNIGIGTDVAREPGAEQSQDTECARNPPKHQPASTEFSLPWTFALLFGLQP